MSEAIFGFLSQLDIILWDYIGIIIILFVGVFLTIYSKFFNLEHCLSYELI